MKNTLATNGVLISVQVFYNPEYSSPQENKFIFVYNISLKNLNTFTVQLIRRHWYIFDSNGFKSEVEGEGVVGKQPVLLPDEVHRYSSWSSISSEMGTMEGTYTMKNLDTGELFEVTIPSFQLIAPSKLN
ncbi:MAG: Co2+/Mg2+ efflux protein ApaG [Saprospiraceae bacterium]|jgi:ApaG protein|nr:Co2+/Mg2+ efflux protein ApaG [Saprospiraceae bacterium]